MSLRAATEADIPALEGYLRCHVEQSMFALSNLMNYGLGCELPQSMRFWLQEGSRGIVGCVGLSGHGFLLPSLPDAGAWVDAAHCLRGERLSGIIAAPAQTQGLMAAMGLVRAATARDGDEPGFTLALSDLLAADQPLAPRKAHREAKAKSCIFLFMEGGVSQMDTFDFKPALIKHAGDRKSVV